jgi:hydrogenase maturation protein HypF
VDGAGYGPDGTVWGGEILLAGYREYERIGTLELFPLIGGDAAVRDPPRLVLALLEQAVVDWRGWEHSGLIDERKAELLTKMTAASPRTSSLGRVLDALACYLGVGTTRTYDGEPAMRLERHLAMGKPNFAFEHEEPKYDGARKARVVMLAPLFRQLHEEAVKRKPDERVAADMARSFVECAAGQMVDIAADRAEKEGIRKVGLTGGVSYNLPLCGMVVRMLERRGLEPMLHDRIPNGDGGVSLGQNVIAGIKGRDD